MAKNKYKQLPICKHQCLECKFIWSGYRMLPIYDEDDPFKIIRYKKLTGPGETVCPECKREYVRWVNYESFAKWYRKHIGDGGCGGEKNNV